MSSAIRYQPALHIQLFGRFMAQVDADVVEDHRWPRRSARALVKRLALAPEHTLHREQLMELLWPEQSGSAAVNSLNKAIHGARRALQPLLERGSDSIFLLTPNSQIVLTAPGGLKVDVLRFERDANRAIRERDPEAARLALRHYGGQLLVEDTLDESTFAQRESVKQLFRTAAVMAIKQFEQRGDYGSAMEIAHGLIREDAADEFAQLFLMRTHVAAGREDLALKQCNAYRKAVRALALEPSAQVQELERSLKGRSLKTLATSDGQLPLVPTDIGVWRPNVVPASFNAGYVSSARWFDEHTLLVNAAWQGRSPQLHRVDTILGTSALLPHQNTELLAVSSTGELALGLSPRTTSGTIRTVTLIVTSLMDEQPHVVTDRVLCADWLPDPTGRAAANLAERLVVVREVSGQVRIEFPVGEVLFETGGWIGRVKFSPDGTRIAFLEHPVPNDDMGHVVVIELEPHRPRVRALAVDFNALQGLGWMDDKVWFAATRRDYVCALYSVDMLGTERLMYQGIGNLSLHDSVDRKLLVAIDRVSYGTRVCRKGEPEERDVSWLERTRPRYITADGLTLLVEEQAAGGRHAFSAYLRSVDGNTTRLLAHAVPLTMSEDERWIIIRLPGKESALALFSVDDGSLTRLAGDPSHPLTPTEYVTFFPCGSRIAFDGVDSDKCAHVYLQDVPGGVPRRFARSESGLKLHGNQAVSPDGRSIVLRGPDEGWRLYDLDTETFVPLPGLNSRFQLLRWHHEGHDLYVRLRGGPPTHIYRYRIADGQMQEWLTLSPPADVAMHHIGDMRLSADGHTCVYSIIKAASDLYVLSDG